MGIGDPAQRRQEACHESVCLCLPQLRFLPQRRDEVEDHPSSGVDDDGRWPSLGRSSRAPGVASGAIQKRSGVASFAEANRERTGTAERDNRDQRDQLPAIGRELAVSCSDPAGPLSQDPAKARRFLGWALVAGAESLQPQTGWRWGQARANPSPEVIP
jgi:hypothetical protein